MAERCVSKSIHSQTKLMVYQLVVNEPAGRATRSGNSRYFRRTGLETDSRTPQKRLGLMQLYGDDI